MKLVRTVRLDDVCRQERTSVRPGERPELRYIGLETIEANTGRFLIGEFAKTPGSPQANSFRFGPEHVLYGKLRPYLNKVALPDIEGKCSTEIIPLLPRPELDRRYLAYFLRSEHTVLRISERTAGARMPRADMDFVLGLHIALPSLEEQGRIVDLLSQAEGIVRLRREAQNKAAAIVPALFLDMFGDPSMNPKGWQKRRLDEVCEISYGLAEKLDTSVTADTGVRILTISNVLLDGNIDYAVERFCVPSTEQLRKAAVRRGDLLFNWRNGSETHIGKTAMWERDSSVLHVSFLLRLRADEEKVTPHFLWAVMKRLRASGYFLSVARQQINRKYNASELSALEVPIPPLHMQVQFATFVKQMRAAEAQQAAATAKAEAAFNALLARVFSENGWQAASLGVEASALA